MKEGANIHYYLVVFCIIVISLFSLYTSNKLSSSSQSNSQTNSSTNSNNHVKYHNNNLNYSIKTNSLNLNNFSTETFSEIKATEQSEALFEITNTISMTEAYRSSEMEEEQNFMFKICTKMDCKSKTTYRIQAYSTEDTINANDKNTTSAYSSIINISSPMNQCKSENCAYCCLSTNRCGTKKQCQNSQAYMNYFNGVFIILCSVMLLLLIIKCLQVDGLPDQTNSDKIDKMHINNLIAVFKLIEKNKRIVNHETQIEEENEVNLS